MQTKKRTIIIEINEETDMARSWGGYLIKL